MAIGNTDQQVRHQLGGTWHPEHLEPDPLRREISCPVVFRDVQKTMTIPQLRAAVLAANNKGQALEAFWKWASQHGVNSDAEAEWWDKMKKLTAPRAQS